MEDFELRFVKELPKDNDNYAIIYNDKTYNGWFRYTLDSDEFKDIIVRFRLPKTLHLYDDVARQFLPEERIVGIHRMLIGSDLQEETKEMLNFTNLNDYVASLDDEQVNKLLDRMKSIVTLNCNKIPYLHIRIRKSLGLTEKDYEQTIKDHIHKQPKFLDIFYNVLNEQITLPEATIESHGVIFSEYLELTNK